MRVAFIWSSFGPYHLARVKAFEKMGVDVVGLSHAERCDAYPFFNLHPDEHAVINDCASDEIKPVLSFFRTLRLLWRFKPDLVLSCGYERPESYAAAVYAMAQDKTVYLMSANIAGSRRRSRLKEWVKKRALRLFDGFVVGGTSHAAYLSSLAVPMEKIVYGYNCVDNDFIFRAARAAVRAGMRLAPCEDYFLSIARFVPVKNLPGLVRAYSIYKETVNRENLVPWKLVIVGDGCERGLVEQAIGDNELTGDIVLPGMVDRFDDIVNYLAFSRLLILASNDDEQWGLVVNEAMAAGKPVLVSHQCGCAVDLVRNGVNGLVFDGNSVEELARLMLWTHWRQERLSGMGENSLAIISQWSPDSLSRNVLSFYEKQRDGRGS